MDKSPVILVVDDEAVNRSIASTVLASAGWQVDEVEDGPAAINAVRNGAYAVVLMDIQMPGLNGFETAEAIRKSDSATATVPIVAFTALPREDAIGRVNASGMDGLIVKPFTAAALISAVEPWRPSSASHPAARLATIFGEAEVASLIERFRQQLLEALSPPDADGRHRARAHEIAGVAGTLGFSEVSLTWLAVAEGDDSSWGAARIAARKAVGQILPGTKLSLND